LAATFALICLFAFAATILRAATTNDLSDAEIQGRQLGNNSAMPAGKHHEHRSFQNPRRKKTTAGNPGPLPNNCGSGGPPGWEACYETTGTNHWLLTISHSADQPNHYRLVRRDEPADLTGNETAIPFAGSTFGLPILAWSFFSGRIRKS